MVNSYPQSLGRWVLKVKTKNLTVLGDLSVFSVKPDCSTRCTGTATVHLNCV